VRFTVPARKTAGAGSGRESTQQTIRPDSSASSAPEGVEAVSGVMVPKVQPLPPGCAGLEPVRRSSPSRHFPPLTEARGMTGPAVAVSGLLCRTVSAGRKRCALKGALLTNPHRLFGTVSTVRLSESPSLVREEDNRG